MKKRGDVNKKYLTGKSPPIDLDFVAILVFVSKLSKQLKAYASGGHQGAEQKMANNVHENGQAQKVLDLVSKGNAPCHLPGRLIRR